MILALFLRMAVLVGQGRHHLLKQVLQLLMQLAARVTIQVPLVEMPQAIQEMVAEGQELPMPQVKDGMVDLALLLSLTPIHIQH
jgi:hypothetical protein